MPFAMFHITSSESRFQDVPNLSPKILWHDIVHNINVCGLGFDRDENRSNGIALQLFNG